MASSLASRHCVPCEGGTPALDATHIQPLVQQLSGWKVEADKRLVKTFRFRNFVEAVGFVNQITPIAEAEGHHPDLLVGWGKVRVTLWTHAAGGLTENDFILAAKIDQAVNDRTPSSQTMPNQASSSQAVPNEAARSRAVSKQATR